MKLLISTILIMFAAGCNAENMLDYMDKTDELIQKGEFEEALERTIWFHNHSLEKQKSISSVRLSFALSDWYEFGKKYPPAMSALINIRNDKEKMMLTEKATCELLDDVSSINIVLSEDNKTIHLFKNIQSHNPFLAKECWYIVKDIVIKQKDDDLLTKYSINVLSEYYSAEESLKYIMDRYKNDSEFIEMNKNIFVEKTLELIDLSLSLNDKETASLISEKARVLVNDKRLDDTSRYSK